MRDIKFRAWDGQEMFDWMEFLYQGNSVIPRTLSHKAEVVMQYTGLKDKDGKEIYEGDIIKIDDNNYVVVFDNLFARFGYCNYDNNARPNWVVSHTFTPDIEVEVIGNIYENPELLN